MWPRLVRAEFEKHKGLGNKKAMKHIVVSGRPPGILAYSGPEPVAWCALAPRETYVVLASSRVLKPVDDRPVWSVVCLFVAKPYRNRGVSARLLEAAASYARTEGARILEGYPAEAKGKLPDAFVWRGLPSAFSKAGFVEAARRSPSRPIMRKYL
jgi:GNAT superfamily N-acetyltransferase